MGTEIVSNRVRHLLRCKRNDKVEQFGKAEIEFNMINKTRNDVMEMNSPRIRMKCPKTETVDLTDVTPQPTRFKTVKIDTKEAYLKRNEAHSQYFRRKPCDQIGIKAGGGVYDKLSAQFESYNAKKVSGNIIEVSADECSAI